MAQEIDILANIFESKTTDCLDLYLSAFSENAIFATSHTAAEGTPHLINSEFASADNCHRALLLLQKYLPDVPSVKVLEKKLHQWVAAVIKIISRKNAASLQPLAYDVLGSLTQSSLRIPELSNNFSQNYLHKIYESLSEVTAAAQLEAIKCTSICLRCYPGPSGPYRANIMKFLQKFIDTPNELLSFESGKCMFLIQELNVRNMSPKEVWVNYQRTLLYDLHQILKNAFPKYKKLCNHEPKSGGEHFKFPELVLANEPVQRPVQHYIRFRNLAQYLIIALTFPSNTPKLVDVRRILQLISQGLGLLDPALVVGPTIDAVAAAALLQKFHLSLTDLLKALILSLNSYLAAYRLSILGIVGDILYCTSSTQGNKNAHEPLRIKAYELLSLWCSIMRSGSGVDLIAEKILVEILRDIMPARNDFTIQILPGGSKHLSKKAKRKLQKAQNDQSNISQAQSNKGANNESHAKKNYDIVVAAAKCLYDMLNSATEFLKPKTIKLIHSKIIEVMTVLHTFPTNARLQLYKVLHIIATKSHHLCSPPTTLIIDAIRKALLFDPNIAARQQCADFLAVIEKMIHPHKAGLQFENENRQKANGYFDLESHISASLQEELTKSPAREESMLISDEKSEDEQEEVEQVENSQKTEVISNTQNEEPSSVIANGNTAAEESAVEMEADNELQNEVAEKYTLLYSDSEDECVEVLNKPMEDSEKSSDNIPAKKQKLDIPDTATEKTKEKSEILDENFQINDENQDEVVESILMDFVPEIQ